MRIDLPQCDFSDCRRRIDGNCNSKEAFRNCKYQQLKPFGGATLLSCEDNGDDTHHVIFKIETPDGYDMTLDAPRCSFV